MYAKDIWEIQIKVTLYTAYSSGVHACCVSTHRTHTVHTHGWKRPGNVLWKSVLYITICILWGFHSCNIEPTTKQTCLSMNETTVVYVSSQTCVILWDPTHTMQQNIMCHRGESYRRRLGSHQWRASCDREKDCSDLDIQLPLRAINAELLSSGSNKWSHSTSTIDKVGVCIYKRMRRRLAWVSHVYNLTVQWWCTSSNNIATMADIRKSTVQAAEVSETDCYKWLCIK